MNTMFLVWLIGFAFTFVYLLGLKNKDKIYWIDTYFVLSLIWPLWWLVVLFYRITDRTI